jgi:hypothetical protein
MEYGDRAVVADDGEEPTVEALVEPNVDAGQDSVPAAYASVDKTIAGMPKVELRLDATPDELMPSRFMAAMVDRVLAIVPVILHSEARELCAEAKEL